jgi:hypothetical protein
LRRKAGHLDIWRDDKRVLCSTIALLVISGRPRLRCIDIGMSGRRAPQYCRIALRITDAALGAQDLWPTSGFRCGIRHRTECCDQDDRRESQHLNST